MAHPDLDSLLNTLLPHAQQMLAKYGEFFPFGASMSTDGKVALNAAATGDEHPSSHALIDLLKTALSQSAMAGVIRAAGICYDIRTIPPGQRDKTDAICASLEHENGEAVDVYLPYKKGWFGRVSYSELFAARRENELFSGPK